MKKVIVILSIIVLAVIGITSIADSTSSSKSYSFGSSGQGSYSFTCYKCHNKGYYECDTCHGHGYVTKYYNTPNYSGTGSYNSTSIKTDCPDCINGVADCRACYN